MEYIGGEDEAFFDFRALYLQHKVNQKYMEMRNTVITSDRLIADSYIAYHHLVYLYIYRKVNNKAEAEYLSQDVFLRLMDYNQMLCKETIRSFIFIIASNLVNDFFRRFYRIQALTPYIYEYTMARTDDVESRVIANDLLSREKYKLSLLPPQRKTVYAMNRFEGKTVREISQKLNLSQRTVENHLFISRKEVREYIKQCI